MDKQEIRKLVNEEGVEVIRLLFTDILGRLKGLNIDESELERCLEEGVQFDGSSVEGFVRIEESDLLAIPDPATFRLFPFSDGGVRSAFLICDVVYPDGRPLESDPRQVLTRTIQRARDRGFDDFFVGPELEYFYFANDRSVEPLEKAGYFDIAPIDISAEARSRTLSTLRGMGINMEAAHHEVAPGQHEIDFHYSSALKMADQVMISKLVVKEVARLAGLYATFMPKPIDDENGSGMHVHQSLFKDGKNAFYAADDPYDLSEDGKRYLAGILKHAKEITSVTNQWVNSYKRLVPGYEAPVYITWGRRNRSALVRVPAFRAGKGESCRVEYRAPDSGANPYLAFAVMLGAGLKGMEEGYELSPPNEQDLYSMSTPEREGLGIKSLPGDLYGATLETSKSALIREVLGDELFGKFLANKYEEWERYRISVTDYEIRHYLPVL